MISGGRSKGGGMEGWKSGGLAREVQGSRLKSSTWNKKNKQPG